MTGTEKLKRVADLCEELQNEEIFEIVSSRIEGLAKELNVDPFFCGFVYWAIHDRANFFSMFGPDVKVRLRAK